MAAQQANAQTGAPAQTPSEFRSITTEDYNRRLQQLLQNLQGSAWNTAGEDYRIGPEDLLKISVFEAPELGQTVRVAASGEIFLPLVGGVQAAGLAPQELELVVQELLRRTYMKNPHVNVFVEEMQSHTVSVFGAVEKPGVFQIRGAKTLIEVLSMAQGLAGDAGDTVIVMRHASMTPLGDSDLRDSNPAAATGPRAELAKRGPSQPAPDETSDTKSTKINLKDLLESGDPRYNVLVYPSDTVKVARAGIVYVVGEVKKPGGFVLKTNENISVLQALALAEGLTATSAKSRARIIRTDEATGARREIPINLSKILAGKAPDLLMRPKDIVFVPNSAGKSALYRGAEAAVGIASGLIVYRR